MAKELSAIYDNDLWLQDLDSIIESLPELSELEGKSVLVTGANGLICSAVIDVLTRYNEAVKKNRNISVTAAGRSPERMRARFGKFCGKDYFTLMHYDASSPEPVKFSADYVIHGASNAHPAAMSTEPVETMLSNFFGTNAFMNYVIHTGGVA